MTPSPSGPKDSLAQLDPALLALTVVRPINHFSGLQTFYPTLSSGKGVAPFASLADYDNALKRHAGYVDYLDAAIARFRQGQASGVVDTKLTITNVIDQLDTQLAQKPEDSAFYGPIKQFPASIGAADRDAPGGRVSGDDRRPHLPRLPPPARLSQDRLSARGARRGRAVVDEGRRRALSRPDREQHHAAARRRGGPPDRPRRSRADHRGDGEDPRPDRLQGRPAGVLRISAHRQEVPAQEPRGADAALLCHRQDRRREASGLFLDHAQDRARDPPL